MRDGVANPVPQGKGERFNIHIEMSLDIEGCDYIPDIVFYERNKIDFLHDKIKSE